MNPILSQILAARLVIPDATGTPRLVLELDDRGNPAMRLFDRHSQERAFLALQDSPLDVVPGAAPITTAHLRLTASDDETAIDIVASEHGSGMIEMTNDPENPACVVLELERPDGSRKARILIWDRDARLQFLVQDGEAEFSTTAGLDSSGCTAPRSDHQNEGRL